MQPLPDIAYTPLLVGEAQVQHGRAQHGVTKPDGPRVLWLWDPEAVAQRSPLARALTDAEEDPAALVAALRDEAADAPIHGAWPLDLAIYRESLAYVQALLEAGADPSQGRALLMACRTDRPYRFLGALLAAGARPADPLGFVADADVHVQAMLAEAWEVPTPPRVPFAALDAHDWAEVHPRLTRAFDALRDDWRESASLLGASTWDFWRHIGIPVLTPALLGTFVILLANALGAYATVYALTTGNFNVLPIRIAAMVAGDISLDPNMASALAMILVGMMTLVTVVHQWLLKRSYHVSR